MKNRFYKEYQEKDIQAFEYAKKLQKENEREIFAEKGCKKKKYICEVCVIFLFKNKCPSVKNGVILIFFITIFCFYLKIYRNR